MTVGFDYGPCEMYGEGEEGPILELKKIEAASKPEPELVNFFIGRNMSLFYKLKYVNVS